MSIDLMRRRLLAAAFAVAGLAAGGAVAQPAQPMSAPAYVKSRLMQVDVYDRNDGRALPVHQKDGRLYIEGVPGHEYAVRIRNCTGGRLLVVTSVDGVNVISGDTAAPSQSGYVLEPWGSVEIAGWRKSLARTAAFYFTDLGDSYAARTGRPQNVGVVGVAAFEEKKVQRITQSFPGFDARARKDAAEPQRSADATADMPASPPAAAPAPAPAESEGVAKRENAQPMARDQLAGAEAKTLGKLGTGHGRSEDSRVTVTSFERATPYPAETVAIQYDRRENLIAMGVLPQPTPYIARRDPNPFPGMRFAPDPR
ncbi:MAG: hypothetical protein U1F41_02970 [Burkholderiales bacterium]